MTKKPAAPAADILKDAPDFVYRGAVVDVRGSQQVITDLWKEGGRLQLALESGEEMAFNPFNVREVPGSIPAFLREGAILRVTDKNGRRFGMPPVLDWEVSSFGVGEDKNGKPQVYVTLKHGKPSRWRSGPFNPRTMVPVAIKAPMTLRKEIILNKPLRFKPK